VKLGVNTFIWSAGFDESNLPLLPRIKSWGFDGVEISITQPSAFPVAAVRKAAEANGLECTVCSILLDGLSFATDDTGMRRKTLAHMKDVIQAAADLGATILGGPLYSPVGYLTGRRRNGDEWKRAVESYQSLTATLEKNGVTLVIEPLNRFETYFLNTAADLRALCEAVNHPNFGGVLDTFHANLEEKDTGQAFRSMGAHLKHVQISENDRGIPGSGHVEWDSVFTALGDIGYDGWLTIESFGFNLGALSSAVCIWRDIETSPELIATEGIKFLKARFPN